MAHKYVLVFKKQKMLSNALKGLQTVVFSTCYLKYFQWWINTQLVSQWVSGAATWHVDPNELQCVENRVIKCSSVLVCLQKENYNNTPDLLQRICEVTSRSFPSCLGLAETARSICLSSVKCRGSLSVRYLFELFEVKNLHPAVQEANDVGTEQLILCVWVCVWLRVAQIFICAPA